MVDIELISSAEGFKGMEEEWRFFSAATFPENIFLDFDWAWTWWRHFSDTCSLFILRGRKDGVTTGIAPLIITRERFLGMTFRIVCFIGRELCDRANFMLLRHKKETLEGMLNFIMMRSGWWDVVDLKEMPGEDENITMLKECIQSSGIPCAYGPQSKIFYISFDDNPAAIISRNIKESMRKSRSRAKKMGKALHIKVVEDFGNGIVDEMRKIEESSWKAENEAGIFLRERTKSFHKEIINKFSRHNRINIRLLLLDEEKISYLYNFRYGRKIYSYSTSYNKRYAHLSPGTFLMGSSVVDFARQGVEVFDFLRGTEMWKKRLTSRYRIHERVRIFNRSIYSSALKFFVEGILPFVRNHKKLYGYWKRLRRENASCTGI